MKMRRAMVRGAVLLALAVSLSNAAAVPTYMEVKQHHAGSDIVVTDRTGMPIERVRHDFNSRRGDWLALGDISAALQNAVIRSEDQRFFEHAGVDWLAMAGAAWDHWVHGGRRGASTISMQLVGLIDPAFRRASGGRSILQKLDQMREARELERRWSKPQILEAYLNLASFRGELVGVDALSRVLFQKHASGLDMREAAVAAVLLRAPNAARSRVVQRGCGLLRDMGRPAECRGLEDFVDVVMQRRAAPRADYRGLAPHFARYVIERSGAASLPAGSVLHTTLDATLQAFAVDSVQRHLRALGSRNVRDAAVVVLDNRTGDILAYVGSSGRLSEAALVDHARALRQAGSTLKPFLYAQAFEQERLTPATLLDDGPIGLPTGNGLYIPRNYDRLYAGWVSVRTALAASLNIPAVRALTMVTPDAFARRLVALGLPLTQTGEFFGFSLALGSADVSLLSLTNAYRALANLGDYSPVRPESSRDDVPARRVMPPGPAWIVGDILSDRQARAPTFGLDSPLSTPFWSAVKTGTSKDMRDNWCVGWSQTHTVGIWVGNSGGGSMHDVSGVTGAGPLWHDIMTELHRLHGSAQPPAPPGVSRQRITF
ncbi:MAG TPA: penicillin-binding protein 1C, partial [Burkholderiaceae bacterium]|nr:penicillin-binding protein 1C [Burkholderiaceae bacterium]